MARSIRSCAWVSLVSVLGGASCGGTSDGASSLVRFTSEGSGNQCAAGGQRIDAGVDDDGDGVLDAEEIDTTAYVCAGSNGADGLAGTDGSPGVDGTNGSPGDPGSPGADGVAGATSLVSLTGEAAGVNCVAGGVRVDVGVDLDGDGQLAIGEIDSTAYVCDGVDGSSPPGTLLEVRPEAAGLNCSDGGHLVVSGVDDDRDGMLSLNEEDAFAYVCDGTGGPAGAVGLNSLVRLSAIVATSTLCPYGGTLIRVGTDLDADGELALAEVEDEASLCSGPRTARVAIEIGLNANAGSPGNSIQTLVPLLLDRGHTVDVVMGTDIDTAVEIDAYDVVVLADSQAVDVGVRDYGVFDSVVQDFVRGGGGIVFSSWFAYIDGQGAANLVDLCPVVLGRDYFNGDVTVDSAPSSPIGAGLSFVSPQYTPYGTLKTDASAWLVVGATPVAAGRAVAAGRTSFVGPMFLDAYGSYSSQSLLDGSQPAAIEFYVRAIEWTAGTR